ncbi:MAG: fumarate hydratase [Oscillospiraceae bacterium]|nr:fumarate hydratase [Oscillospiraceae bacterium]
MRIINVSVIKEEIARLCAIANLTLPCGLRKKLSESAEAEESPLCKEALGDLIRNLESAKKLKIPLCQDTGLAVVFLEIGQEVQITGGDLKTAVNEGVEKGYKENFLRLSIVSDPLFQRKNTGTNTPAIIHTEIVSGSDIYITVAPKGFGSENKSRIKMFNPTASEAEIIAFIKETVSDAGASPCPPVVAGVGIGGDFEYAALLSKKALCRDINVRNPNPLYAKMEEKCLAEINKLGIGALGYGGRITAFAVNIMEFPTHIAGLPVAVNMGCHATRHASGVV